MDIEFIKKRFKQSKCDHSAYKMLPVWNGLFGIAWECTQCGIIKRNLEANK